MNFHIQIHLALHLFLVEEVPTHTESEHPLIEWVVRSEEICPVALSCIHMTHHYEETRVLQMKIGIYVHHRVVAHLRSVVSRLYGILSEGRTVVRRIIFCEIPSVGAKIAFQYVGNFEFQIQISVYVEIRNRYDVIVG